MKWVKKTTQSAGCMANQIIENWNLKFSSLAYVFMHITAHKEYNTHTQS